MELASEGDRQPQRWRRIFKEDYWQPPLDQRVIKGVMPLPLTRLTRPAARQTFLNVIPSAMAEEVVGTELPQGAVFDPAQLETGTILLYDLEMLGGVTKEDREEGFAERLKDYNNYPTLVENLINNTSRGFIQSHSNQSSGKSAEELFRPAQVRIRESISNRAKVFTRRVWFGLVLDYKNERGIVEIGRVNRQPTDSPNALKKPAISTALISALQFPLPLGQAVRVESRSRPDTSLLRLKSVEIIDAEHYHKALARAKETRGVGKGVLRALSYAIEGFSPLPRAR